MKVKITFKDPDAVYEAIEDALAELPRPEGVTAGEWDEIKEGRRDDIDLMPFIEWQEYCTVEIDTEKKTSRVVPVGEK